MAQYSPLKSTFILSFFHILFKKGYDPMKSIIRKIAPFAVILALTLLLTACSAEEKSDLWADAIHTKDMEIGEGAKTFTIEVKAEEKSVKFTVSTDKETVGDALLEHKLIDGEAGNPGIYITSVNGMVADYDENMSYWAFYINDDYATTGADSTPIDESASYKMEYTIME